MFGLHLAFGNDNLLIKRIKKKGYFRLSFCLKDFSEMLVDFVVLFCQLNYFLGAFCLILVCLFLLQDKVSEDMADTKEQIDATKTNTLSEDDDIVESDIELDDSDVVEPDNDPPQKVNGKKYWFDL